MTKRCHKCGKELNDIFQFKCRHCGKIFCIDHFLPENHNCPDFKPRLTKTSYIERSDISKNAIFKTQLLEEQNNILEKEILTKPKGKKTKLGRNKIKAIMTILLITILLLFSVFGGGYYFMNRSYYNLKNEIINLNDELKETWALLNISNNNLDTLEKKLENYTIHLQENLSELNILKSGNEYQLHDPLYSEVVDFIKNDNSETEKALIERAKKQGIRCAYVVVSIVGSIITLSGETSSGGYYPLVGFSTVDKGMVYFESVTDYRVFPEIGRSYVDCVEGKPYWSDPLTNDMITDILIIW